MSGIRLGYSRAKRYWNEALGFSPKPTDPNLTHTQGIYALSARRNLSPHWDDGQANSELKLKDYEKNTDW